MEKSDQSLKDMREYYSIRNEKKRFVFSTVATLVLNTVGFLAGLGIGGYFNNIISPEVENPEIALVQHEQDPHKYTPLKPKSDDPHHYIPNNL